MTELRKKSNINNLSKLLESGRLKTEPENTSISDLLKGRTLYIDVSDLSLPIISDTELIQCIREAALTDKSVELPIGIYLKSSFENGVLDLINYSKSKFTLRDSVVLDLEESVLSNIYCFHSHFINTSLNHCFVESSYFENTGGNVSVIENSYVNSSVIHPGYNVKSSVLVSTSGTSIHFEDTIIHGGEYNFSFCDDDNVVIVGGNDNVYFDSQVKTDDFGMFFTNYCNDLWFLEENNITLFQLDPDTRFLPLASGCPDLRCSINVDMIPDQFKNHNGKALALVSGNRREVMAGIVQIALEDIAKFGGVSTNRLCVTNNNYLSFMEPETIKSITALANRHLSEVEQLNTNPELLQHLMSIDLSSFLINSVNVDIVIPEVSELPSILSKSNSFIEVDPDEFNTIN